MKIKALKYIVIAIIFGFFTELSVGLYLDLKKELKFNYQKDKTIVFDSIKQQENYLKVIATELTLDPTVIKAFQKNSLSMIKNHLINFWKISRQKKYIYEMHFFKPPAISFAHFSNFSTCGKDIRHVRADIVWVISSFRPSTHLYVCKTYPGIRATMPVIYNNKVLGALSLGKKIDWLPEEIKKLTLHNSFLIYLDSDLHSLAPKYYKAFLKNKTKLGNYIFANPTNKNISPDIVKKINFNKNIQMIVFNHHIYIINKYTLIDFKKNKMAYLFTLYKIDAFMIEALKKTAANIFLMILTALLVYLFFYNQLSKDSLTGLYNIIKLKKNMDKDNIYLALINIKEFKSINEAFGFNTGNYIIKTIAEELKHLDNFDVYRTGADEFAVTNKTFMKKKEFVKFIETNLKKIEKSISEHNRYNIEIDLYIGISFEKNYLFETADMALRNAKNNNKFIVVFESYMNMTKKEKENLSVLNKIKKAIKNKNFILYYQPILNKENRIVKYEALIRMKDNNQILTPNQFLPVAQKTKYYEEITKFVISEAISAFDNKKELVSINFSVDDFLNEKTIQFLKEQIKRYNVNLVIEILENMALDDRIINTVTEIKKMGIKIALDDFGSGYSNFSNLLKLKPDYLKIDGSLIKSINVNETSKKIIKTIVSFGQCINAVTVAEFVYNESTYKIAKKLNIDEFQGYYLGKPKPLH
jgi:diguanylate cyclase (GGDEF)-like protein